VTWVNPDGTVVMYFHGTPGSRLDLCFGEQLAAGRGVRLISFDRRANGEHLLRAADELSVARFATLGMSGGGPAALAAVGQAGGAKNSRAIPSGSRKETPEP
jgi:pimeloyl-ACP methyl ester carboxylesterase